MPVGRLVALQLIDEVAGLPNAEFVRGGQAVALAKLADQVDLTAAADGPDRPDLTGRSGTGAGLVAEDGTVGRARVGTVGRALSRRDARDRGAADGRAGADLDDLLRLGDFRAVAGQPGDLVLHGLLARLVGPTHDDLKALGVVEEAGVEFGLDGAGG